MTRFEFTKTQKREMLARSGGICEVSISYLSECFELDAENGTLYWKERPQYHFTSYRGWNIFNVKYAGKFAGTLNNTGYFRINSVNLGKLLVHRIIWALVHGYHPNHGRQT